MLECNKKVYKNKPTVLYYIYTNETTTQKKKFKIRVYKNKPTAL